ncbi:MAG: NAD(P)-dependent oxidoreductase [Myxococcota bacterium]
MSDERVFLTGGAGLIGSNVAKKLVSLGHEVLLFDSFTAFMSPFQVNYAVNMERRFPPELRDVRIVRGDVRHRGLLSRTLGEFQPTRVIHLAALPIADLSNRFSEEAMESNLIATVTLLDAVQALPDLRRIVYTSSSMVYGDFQYAPADEDHPKAPKDLYGGTKLAGEVMVEAYGRRFDIPYTIIRPSAVYGPTDVNRRVTQIFVENALRGQPIVLHNGGTSKLDFTHVDDVADGFVRATLSEKGRDRIYNITRGRGRSLKELAELIASLVPGTRFEESPPDVLRPERDALSIERAQAELGFEPKLDLEDGMPPYVEFVRRVFEESGQLRK